MGKKQRSKDEKGLAIFFIVVTVVLCAVEIYLLTKGIPENATSVFWRP